MGSSQGKPLPEPDAKSVPAKSNKKQRDEPALSGMALVEYKCRKKKRRYDKCVSEWYKRDFMGAKSMDQDEACGDVFELYRTCMLRGIKKEVWDKQGLPPPKEGSALAELEDDDT